MSCERSLVWSVPGFRPSCSVVADLERGECIPDAIYHYEGGLYRGQLFVLANGQTYSAAEDLAARLQENDAAQIVGEKTGGAGCGHTNGGFKLVLANSGVRVKMPDCARYLKDGRNEVEGILPDQAIPDFVGRLKTLLGQPYSPNR